MIRATLSSRFLLLNEGTRNIRSSFKFLSVIIAAFRSSIQCVVSVKMEAAFRVTNSRVQAFRGKGSRGRGMIRAPFRNPSESKHSNPRFLALILYRVSIRCPGENNEPWIGRMQEEGEMLCENNKQQRVGERAKKAAGGPPAFEIKRACIGYGRYQIESNLVSSSAFYESRKQRESRSISARDENVER